jgi:hypothetical protein
MNTYETPRQAEHLSRDDCAPSRTDRLIASADAQLEVAGQSIENNKATLKQSRAFLSSDDTARSQEVATHG